MAALTTSPRNRAPQTIAKAGIRNVDAKLLTTYQLSKNCSLLQLVGLSHLSGDAGRTPITEKRTLLSTAIGISYAF